MTWWTHSHPWRSGRWSLQRRDDELADIAVDGRVVLRSVRAVVRDHDWDTATLTVDAVRAEASVLELDVHTRDLGADLSGLLRVEVDGDALTVSVDLRSAKAFDTNRTGLVVLHPHGLAGTPLEVTHSDRSHQRSAFPVPISPHQPVMDIQALTWEDAGQAVRVDFTGDVFEMEDQRNWSDASYKTYNRPLDLPFPYTLSAGEQVRQSVRVSVSGERCAPPAVSTSERIELLAGGSFPDLLLGSSTAPDPSPTVPPIGAGRLVELDLASPSWRAALERAASVGMPLDVRIVLADDGGDDGATGLDAAADALRGLDLLRVSAYPPTGPSRHVSDVATTRALRAALGRAGVDAPVVGGARSHFTELNRERHRLPSDLAGVAFGITPLFHSLGTEQLVESIAIQRLIARQATSMTDRPVHIGPISLRPHFNDVATTPAPQTAHDDLRDGYGPQLLDADDDRQDASELAAWTIASAAALAVSGVASLTYFEEWGPRGVRDASGREFPVAAAVRALAGLRGRRLLSADSPDGLIWAVGASTADAETVFVANLDRVARRVSVASPRGEHVVQVGRGAWTEVAGEPSRG